MTTTKPSIFISYSHHDEVWLDRLVKHLRLYELEERLTVWEDRQICAGQDWLPEIKSAIRQARVAVLLVSNDFLVSPFIRDKEVAPILARRSQEGLIVVPVMVKDCNWQDVPWLSGIQARPLGKPLFALKGNDREKALAAIAREIKHLLQAKAPPSTLSPPDRSLAQTEARSAFHQLPAPPLDFTGRAAELAVLKAVIREDKTTAIFSVHGLGGVGKTALALKLANEIAPLYPDGQIFLDLLGVTNPLSAAEAMAHVIRSFEPGSKLPASQVELAPLYRSVLYGKRVLLLMDNAAGRQQLEPLLPPEGSALLVTSRIRFSLPGLLERDLDELPREESCQLLLRICPRIERYAGDLAKVCADLPLALRVAASTLQERRTLSPPSYLQRLSTGRERLEPVERTLSLSYKLLSEELRRRWCQLAVFPDTFDQEAAAAVWGVDSDTAEPILAELERSSLVEWEEASERYHLHDLLHSFVRQRLSETEMQEAREKHARHYLNVLGSANVLYLGGGSNLIRGLKLFDLEWRNIRAGQAFAAGEAAQSDEAAWLCNSYPLYGAHCLHLRRTPGERIPWLEVALAAARRLGDRAAEGKHLGNLGNAYGGLGELGRALELYEQQLKVTREVGDRQSEGNALNNMGVVYMRMRDPRQAIDLLNQRLAIAREIGDRRGEGTSLSNLGLAHADLGDPLQGIRFYEQHLAIAREIGDRRGEGYALKNLGNAYDDSKDSRQAIAFYEQYLSIAREIGDRQEEAVASWNLGRVYEQDDPRRAVELMQVCVDLEREIDPPSAEADAAHLESIRARIDRK